MEATKNYNDPELIARVSEDLGEPMSGIVIDEIAQKIDTQNVDGKLLQGISTELIPFCYN